MKILVTGATGLNRSTVTRRQCKGLYCTIPVRRISFTHGTERSIRGMQILVFSDSHGTVSNMKKAIQANPRIEYIIHLGDYGTDLDEIISENPLYLFDAVQGNCDRKKQYPMEKILQLAGKRILITHGHGYGVKYGFSSLLAKGLHEKDDAVLFGHTHEPLVDNMEGILLVNPGSISRPRTLARPTYAILEISKEGINAKICRV